MKKIFLIITLLATAFAVSAQDNQVKRIPSKGYDPNQQQYTTFNRGFWFAAEAMGGISCHLKGHNLGFTEVDFTAGYRFSQYLRAGVGLGARYYIKQEELRRGSIKWGMPIFLAVRGNLMPGEYRHAVPFYSVEVGGSVRDGFMLRPSIGVRIGEPREAFVLALSYMGQNLATYDSEGGKCSKYTNFIALRLGYEF